MDEQSAHWKDALMVVLMAALMGFDLVGQWDESLVVRSVM
jgi:hypothetical protein